MNKVTITAGSDATLNLAFRDGAGNPIGVSNPVLILADERLVNRVVITPTGDVGDLRVFIEGTNLLRVGEYAFRIRVTKQDGNSVSTPEIKLNVI